MKIGIICPYNIFNAGGVQEHVFAQYAELKSRGHQVRIITARPSKYAKKPPEDVIFIGSSTTIKFNAPFHTEFDLAASVDTDVIDLILEAEQFDILHAHEPWLPMLGSQVLSRASCPTLGTLHAIWPQSMINRTIQKARTPYVKSTLRSLDQLTAVSEAAASNLDDIVGGDDLDKELEIVPNGIDLSKFKSSNVKRVGKYVDDKKTILFIGRLEKRKGVLQLLKAYKKLKARNSDIRLLIAGKGNKKSQLQDYVVRNGLEDVEFLGFVSERMKLRLLKTADVFVSPAMFGESFGIVLLEAMAMQAVTVAGNNAGYSTVMTGLGKLSLINPKHTESFVERLELLIYDQSLRSLWTDWAEEHVKQFTYTRVVDSYEDIYRRLVANATKGK